jgi:ABC-2 type transport system permease protein
VSEPPVTLEKEAVSSKSVSYYDFILPGLVAMGVMNYSISGIAVSLSRFREQRILKRILATPLAPSHFLVAQVFAHLLLALVQAVLILAVGILLFGGHVYGSIPALLLLVTLANIIFLNIGFAIAGRAANPEAASGVANAVALPMMFLSGVFFPTSTLPDVMQKLVALLPLTPLIEAMRKISIDGAALTECDPQLLALAIWVVVSFALARLNFSFTDRGA